MPKEAGVSQNGTMDLLLGKLRNFTKMNGKITIAGIQQGWALEPGYQL